MPDSSKPTISRSIVIDTSIARSAGSSDASCEQASSCRNLLIEVLEICHHFATSPEIEKEWNKHQSPFSVAWLTEMERRGKVDRYNSTKITGLSGAIGKLKKVDQGGRAKMQKDRHLVEAARVADKIIATYDGKAATHFRWLAQSFEPIVGIQWLDVSKSPATAISFLRRIASQR